MQLLDPDLKLVGYNDRLFEVLNLDREAIVEAADPGRALREAVAKRGDYGPGNPAELVAWREERTLTGERVHFRQRMQNGHWVECRGTPIMGQGYLGVFRDVTGEVEREAKLREANESLATKAAELVAATHRLDAMRLTAESALAEADRANRAKSIFLANISHELRTPLNAINGFSEIIANLQFGAQAIEKYREYARDIHASGHHLLRLINSILDLAKVEAGRMDLREEVVDLSSCLRAAVRMVEPASSLKQQDVKLLPLPEAIDIRCDEQKLLQSFLNVLSNAVKFTPNAGAISIEVRLKSDEVAVAFKDNGVGIGKADLARVFTPFSQIESVMARTARGTGLGMPLTKNLIELHGGRIELESVVGEGTTVTIVLPASRVLRQELKAAG